MTQTRETTSTTATTAGAVESLRPLWESLDLAHVDVDPDYFQTVVAHDPEVVHPRVQVLRGADGSPVLLVGRVADRSFRARLGYQTLGRLRARALVVSFEGVVGATTPADLTAARDALMGVLDSGEVDVVVAQKVDVTSAWFEHLTRVGPAWRRFARSPTALWSTDLPGSWDDLLAARSSKSRRQIRYDDNRLRRDLGPRLELRRLDSPEHQHRLAPDLAAVAELSYQRGLGVSVAESPVQAALLELARQRGWLRVWMLYVDERPVAFWWGVARHGTLTTGSPGFDPAFARQRVGYYTLRRMLEDACADPAISRIDYGPGDADYKSRFGTHCAEVADVHLFAGRPRSMAVQSLLRTEQRAGVVAHWVAERGGRVDDLKRRWRRHLAAGGGSGAADADGG
jgi:CelD/BcsL family acetyltransferase involved in cellulose biosynthesis